MGQKLNCKISDLAIVIKAELPVNIGNIVEVIAVHVNEPMWNFARHGHTWVVKTVSGRMSLNYEWSDGRCARTRLGPVPDSYLKPVSGLSDADSVSGGAAKPKARRKRKVNEAATTES